MVGKILEKRYVVLEEVGADGPGFRYLVYDMNSLKRMHLRVVPDENGELTGSNFTVVEPSAPTGAPEAPEEGKQSKPPIQLVKPPEEQQDRPRQPTPKGFVPATGPKEKVPQPAPEPVPEPLKPPEPEGEKESVTLLRSVKSTPPPVSKRGFSKEGKAALIHALTRAPAPKEEEPPLEQALEQALARDQAQTDEADAVNVTQPIDLATAEEIQEEEAERIVKTDQEPEPQPEPPTERPRHMTKKIEAAWFAQGDQLDEEEREEVTDEPVVDQAELERQAMQLSPEEYRKYALDLPPPVVPPTKIVDAFLEAKPDLIAKAHAGPEDLEKMQPAPVAPASKPPEEPSSLSQPPPRIAVPVVLDPVPTPAPVLAPRATLPGTGADPAATKEKEEAASRATLPGTAPDPALVREKEAAPPVPTPDPPVPVDPLVPPAPATSVPAVIPGLQEMTGQAPPAAAVPLEQETPPPVAEAEPPAATKDELPVQLPSPPSLPLSLPPAPPQTETEAVRATAELLKPVSLPVVPVGPTASYAGIALKKSPSPVSRILESRLAVFVIGILAGGLVIGPVTCLIASGGDPAPQSVAKPAPAPAVAQPSRPQAERPKPAPVPAPKPAPEEPAPNAREAAEPAPVTPAKPRVRLSRSKVRRLNKYLRLSRKAMKRRRYRTALNWASKALKVKPGDQRARRLKARAKRKLRR